MQIESKFYERLHKTDATYGLSHYDVPRLIGAAAFQRMLGRANKNALRVLEIAVGKGQFLLELTEGMRNSAAADFKRIVALDLVRAPNHVLDQIQPKPEFVQQSVDGEKLPFPDGSFDLVICNHVLEHIFQTEFLVREIRRVTQPQGLAVISVPNCAAWMNRIAFLFGGQPLGSEVGTERITYGFWPGFLQDRLKKFDPSGHIRDFTPRSLRDLTSHCGFAYGGWWAQNGGLFPTMKRNIGILLEPLPS